MNVPAQLVRDTGWEQDWNVDRRHIREAIAGVARNHETELFLYNEGLLHVPSGISRLQMLQRLHLGANALSVLPESFAQLKGLQFLGLGRNRFSVFPEILCFVTRLQELLLFDNLLAELPISVGRLCSLRRFQLQGNQLQTLPSTVCHLKSLCELELHNNHLRTLPPSLCHLSPDLDLQGAGDGQKSLQTIFDLDQDRSDTEFYICIQEKAVSLGSLSTGEFTQVVVANTEQVHRQC